MIIYPMLKKKLKIKGGIGNFHCVGYGAMDESGKIVESCSFVATPRRIRHKGKSITVFVPIDGKITKIQ